MIDHFQPPESFNPSDIPAILSPWLSARGSMTKLLKRSCKRFDVVVLQEQWHCAREDELTSLGITASENCWVREVELRCDSVPVMYARVVLPKSTFDVDPKALGQLGNKPLGEVLFAKPDTTRGAFAFAHLPITEYTNHSYASGLYWARRSTFHYQQKPLLVTEVFLPPYLVFPDTTTEAHE